jgi:hypothetical protein
MMKLLASLALALALNAEEPITITVAGTVNKAYLLWIEYPQVRCYIEGMHGPRVIVEKGTALQCWEATIQEHNRQMDDHRAHLILDESLVIMARAFGKHFKADMQ